MHHSIGLPMIMWLIMIYHKVKTPRPWTEMSGRSWGRAEMMGRSWGGLEMTGRFLTSNSGTRRRAKPSYLYKLPKEQARAIFMARTRMIKVKTNYKNMYTNTICRGCGLKEETQQHVLEECTSIHTQDNLITTTSQLFSNDPTKTKPTSNKLTTLINTIHGWEQA